MIDIIKIIMITKKLIESLDFGKIADQILNNYELVIKDQVYRICEIEFYCRCSKHEDKYTHCNKDQMEYEKFYFHKYNNGTYKAGTYKGIDITFGNNNMYFGILIRSIYNEQNNEFIEGPCRTVNKILEINECSQVKELIGDEILGIYGDERVKIRHNKDLIKKSIYIGPRIGLSDKYPDYKLKKYRFIINSDKIKKDKKSLELMV